MNHAYRLVWNESTQSYVPAAEGTRARKKSGGCKAFKHLGIVAAAAAVGSSYIGSAHAGPSGGEVVAGQASINQTGSLTTVSQQTQNVSLDWQEFNIGVGEVVQFVQPSSTSIALNRVVGSEASQIFGQLSANGRVFLINPNGVLFGHSAQVDVGGLVASTLNVSDADFLAGRYRFASDTATPGSVVNEGTITAAAGGSVALLGGQVSNQGTISARLGTVALAAGSAVSLDFSGQQLMNVRVDEATLGALVRNQHLIQADGGTVIMTAAARDALLSTVVNNTGVIEARTVQNQNGVIKLLGSFEGGTVDVGGTLDASAPDGGDGGFIETSGAYVKVADTAHITTAAAQGDSGLWLIDPADYTIAASGGDISGATLSASLQNGNVTILSTQGTINLLGDGDIHVNDDVTWSSDNTLTLTALHDVNVNAAITNTGSPTGRVSLRADSAGACVAGAAASACGTINFSGTGHINAGNVDLYYNPAGSNALADANGNGPSYATPTDFSGNVIGTLSAYMLVNDVNQLQAISTNLAGRYALGTNIDASATSGWNGGAGFNPIGANPGAAFTGGFDGLGHTISNLHIDRTGTSFVGLFGVANGNIHDVGLLGGSVSGDVFVGGLVGLNQGTVRGVSASTQVSGTAFVGGMAGNNTGTLSGASTSGAVSGQNVVGGLLGSNDAGTVSDVSASGSVTGGFILGGLVGSNTSGGTVTLASASGLVDGQAVIGGLVGQNTSGASVRNSSASGAVRGLSQVGGVAGDNSAGATLDDVVATGDVTGDDSVGGLVGTNSGTVGHAAASGRVTGDLFVGGLVGQNGGTIVDAHATGRVIGVESVGGLVGSSSGTINVSYAEGEVSGELDVGGLAGSSLGLIGDVHATGRVSGGEKVGGLIGTNGGTVANAHATGAITGRDIVGGLAGLNDGTITNVHATGVVDGDFNTGGLVGLNTDTIVNAYATGTVSGGGGVGGLVGTSEGTISNTYATGTVSASYNAGGLVGTNDGVIDTAHASGSVSAADTVGGLVGSNSGTVAHAHATGVAAGDSYAGGLIGINAGAVSNAYATGALSGTYAVGGLVGTNEGGTVDNAWYNADQVTINGAHQVTLGALFDGQYQDWIDNGQTLDIADYAASLPFDAGTGSYLIGSVQGLRDLLAFSALGGYSFRLVADLDLSAAAGLYIPDFRAAQFDGAGHTIANLSIDALASDIGMFGYVGSTSLITNVRLAGGAITGLERVGALAGVNEGTISNSSATVSVTGEARVGGLVGRNEGTISGAFAAGQVSGEWAVGGLAGSNDGSITVAYATGAVSGEDSVGGLVGSNEGSIAGAHATGAVSGEYAVGGLAGTNDGSIAAAYATGAVSGEETVGGLAGMNSGTVSNAYATNSVNGMQLVGGLVGINMHTVSDAYATGSVDGQSEVGGLVGANGGAVVRTYATGSVSGTSNTGGLVGVTGGIGGVGNSFWDIETTGQSQSAGGVGLTTAETMSAISFNGALDLTNTWFMVDGATRPFLRSEYSTTITNAHQLQLMALDTSADYVLANDIDMSELTRASGLWNNARGFVPIAAASMPFTGRLDGAGHTITGLYINQPGLLATGLVAALSASGTIANIGLIDASITGDFNTGALVGSNAGTIINAYSIGSVTASNTAVGGLVGDNSGVITDAFAIGTVNGLSYIGGLAGRNDGSIERAYATATVSGESLIGGLVGRNDGTIGDAYATGAVSGSASSVGGLVGANFGDIARTYSTGPVVGTAQAGGLVGFNDAGNGAVVSDSFWDVETSGQSDLFDGRGTGRTSAEMRDVDTFSAWNIANAGGSSAVWRIYDGYTGPLLRTFLTDITLAVDDVTTTYNGTGQTFNITFDAGNADTSLIFSGNASFRNAGAYSLGNHLYSGQRGYDITYSGGALNIARANLTLAASSATRTYDGTTASSGNVIAYGIMAGDGVSATQTYASRNVMGIDGSTLQVAGYSITDSSGADMIGNYNVSTTTAAGTITAATLTVGGAIEAADRTYDATVAATVSGGVLSGVIGADVVDLMQSGTFDDKNAGADKLVTATFSLAGIDAGNYALASDTATTTANITPRALTYTTSASSRVYDGTTAAVVTLSDLTGLIGDETLVATGEGTFNSKDVTTAHTVTVNTATLADGSNGGLARNYSIAAGGTANASITPASLTVTADDRIKATGTPNPELTLSYTGFVAGESAANLTTRPSASTTASLDSPEGTYAITASGAASANYVFTYVPGTLTVTNTEVPGYLATLAYLDDLGGEDAVDAEDEDERLGSNSSLLQVRDEGIRLPAGVR